MIGVTPVDRSAPAMLASEETWMSRLAELGIAKRLALIVVAGIVALAALAAISFVGHRGRCRGGRALGDGGGRRRRGRRPARRPDRRLRCGAPGCGCLQHLHPRL